MQELKLEDISIIHLSRNYIRKGDLEIHKLFSMKSVVKQVKQKQQDIEKNTQIFRDTLNLSTPPDIKMGTHCNKPYSCDFKKYCSKGLPVETTTMGKFQSIKKL